MLLVAFLGFVSLFCIMQVGYLLVVLLFCSCVLLLWMFNVLDVYLVWMSLRFVLFWMDNCFMLVNSVCFRLLFTVGVLLVGCASCDLLDCVLYFVVVCAVVCLLSAFGYLFVSSVLSWCVYGLVVVAVLLAVS